MHRATRRQLLGMGVLAGVAIVAGLVLSPGTVVSHLEHLATRPVWFAVALTLVYLARPFLFWPVSAVAVVLGYLYGPVLAFPVALLGAGVTGLPPFGLARWAQSDAGLLSVLAEPGRQLIGAVGETRGVVAGRLSPVPGDAVSYAAGLSEVSVGAFLLGTVLGEVPWALVAVLAGDSMRTLTVEGIRPDPALVVGIAGLAVLVLGRPAYHHLRGDPVGE